jgi:hypothetical protein
VILLLILSVAHGPRALAQSETPPSAAGSPPAAPSGQDDYWPANWPRNFKAEDGTQFILYEPQLDSWNGNLLTGRAAVAVKAEQEEDPTYGVVWLKAQTTVDKENRVVTLEDLDVTKVKFPAAAGAAATYQKELEAKLHGMVKTMALDQLEAQLKIMNAVQVTDSKPVKNDPPRIIFSSVPAILVYIDGDPAWRPVQGTDVEKALNTPVLLLKDSSDYVYLHVFDGWMTADSLQSQWLVDNDPPPSLAGVLSAAEKDGHVDLLEGTLPQSKDQGQTGTAAAAPGAASGSAASPPPPSLSKTVPVIYVATTPTELIVTEGTPDYVPIQGTDLLYLSNTTGDVFKYIDSDKTYVLIAGRWFSAPSTNGPWQYVPGSSLPPDFAKIPDDSGKENVKASVPGTVQAQEALIANGVPQTAQVDSAKMSDPPPPQYDGKPDLEPIQGTSMQYVKNASLPVIQVAPGACYMVNNGVWFTSTSLNGPWMVATYVPSVIYTIPPSSPLHYVTYTYVYGSQGSTVYVGYTPGYYGTVVSNGVVVYGTGYAYSPWIGTVWYGPPVTYGYGACMTYSPWAGWAFAFGMGWAWGAATAGWGWGPYPHWGPYAYYPRGAYYGPHGSAAVWGPGGWAGTTGNVYHRWGNTQAVTRSTGGYNAWTGNAWRTQSGMSYNSRTGTLSAGQRGVVANAYTGQYAAGSRVVSTTPSGSTVTAGRGVTGNAYTGQETQTGYVRGEQGGVAKSGNDTYASYDGNLYQKGPSGNWSQYDSSTGNWNSVPQSQVDQAHQQAEQQAQQRAQQAPQERQAAQSSASAGLGNFDSGSSGQGGFGSGGFDRSGGGFSSDGSESLNDDFNARSDGDWRTQGLQSAGGFGGFRGGGFGGGGFGGGFRR